MRLKTQRSRIKVYDESLVFTLISAKMEISLRQFLLLLITLWSFCFHLHVGFVRSQCLEDQQSLLIQLKDNLTFNSTLSFKLVSWNSSTDCCTWVGVACSSGGKVIGLDLSNEWIHGGIDNSSRLFDLRHLHTLNLASNQFGFSVIPSGLGKLANLRHLNLSDVGFAGQIPADISSLTRLVSLSIKAIYNDSGLPQMRLENPNLSMLVRNMTSLSELYLSRVDISAEGPGCCRAVSSLTKLRVLILYGCRLSGPIDSSLSNLKSLSEIKLQGLSGPIPEFLGNLSNLTSLDLRECDLKGKFPEKVFQLPRLRSLSLGGNADLHGLLPEFPENGSLETLDLRGTRFWGELPESIGNLKRLTSIALYNCSFSGSIPDTIAKLTQLVYVDFSANNFSGSILSPRWSSLSKLIYLDLSNNSLNGVIPVSLFAIPSLRQLRLNQNQFTKILDQPLRLASSTLVELDLSYNKVAGPFPVIIPQLRSIRYLTLFPNKFSGPVNLGLFQNLTSLSVLDLSYNGLWVDETGVNPASLPKFGSISLASCNLTRFPHFLKEQSVMRMLDLSNNQIGGEIPNWVWSSELSDLDLSHNILENFQKPFKGFGSTLSFLDLSNNKLQEELPKLPPSLYFLDLSDNKLQGELPQSILYSSNNVTSVIPADFGIGLNQAPSGLVPSNPSTMPLGSFISLANNNLHGSIPHSFCNVTDLLVLNLSNNSLVGSIPQCLFGMSSLWVLNLRGNKLSGNIADTFPSYCTMQTIDVHGNQLQGKIPGSLVNCKLLEVLDLGNNKISDTFPCHLESLSTLRILVLRSNHLQGPIGCSNTNFSWQKLQIVDLASNNFSGVLPIQVLRTWKSMMQVKDEAQQIGVVMGGVGQEYYQDSITVTTKDREIQLVKILTIFTSIDFSCNNFEGKIPDLMGEFSELYTLNLSHNSFTSLIPSSLGNLRKVESLDLSCNNLSGEIPHQLADLNFLAVLNLSHNQLEGRIPRGNQFQTFSEDSFSDNKGLCGEPLKKNCSPNARPPQAYKDKHSDDGTHVDWNFLCLEVGFVFGLGIVIFPLMFWRRWRIWYYGHVDVLLSRLLPRLYQRSGNRGSRTSRRTRTMTQLRERNTIAGNIALQPQASKLRKGRRTSGVVVV